MLTLFSCPKPFKDHIDIIQQNAITSWTLLKPRPEIVLLGNDNGVAEICASLRLKHVPFLEANESGVPLVDDLFRKGQQNARHNWVGYINADIILMQDVMSAFQFLKKWKREWLMVGCRIDVDITNPLDFQKGNWQQELRDSAQRDGRKMEWSSDYFVFPKGSFLEMPSFVIGRTSYDNWLLWYARKRKIPIVDVSRSVQVIHQKHPTTVEWSKFLQSPAVLKNKKLIGWWARSFILADADYQLSSSGVQRRFFTSRLNRLKILFNLFEAEVRSVLRHL